MLLMLMLAIVLDGLLFDYEHEHDQERDENHIPII